MLRLGRYAMPGAAAVVHLAAQLGKHETIAALIQHGADKEATAQPSPESSR